jgi:hypothetical protein
VVAGLAMKFTKKKGKTARAKSEKGSEKKYF